MERMRQMVAIPWGWKLSKCGFSLEPLEHKKPSCEGKVDGMDEADSHDSMGLETVEMWVFP